jgi:hypothetical protein
VRRGLSRIIIRVRPISVRIISRGRVEHGPGIRRLIFPNSEACEGLIIPVEPCTRRSIVFQKGDIKGRQLGAYLPEDFDHSEIVPDRLGFLEKIAIQPCIINRIGGLQLCNHGLHEAPLVIVFSRSSPARQSGPVASVNVRTGPGRFHLEGGGVG